MSIDDATPQEWDRAFAKSKSRTPHDAELKTYEDAIAEAASVDPVKRPPHYNTGNIECIDAIQESMSPEAFKGYCKGNALKYIWRMSYKNKPVEDLRKANWYIKRLIESELEHPTPPLK